ncbi:hypothetical protein JCM11641_002046 [Rhodosporidiobolus odoratus]
MPRAPPTLPYYKFDTANGCLAVDFGRVWQGQWYPWMWLGSVGEHVITREVWKALKPEHRTSVLAKYRTLDEELKEGRLKREEWEDNQAKWERMLMSWLPDGIQIVARHPATIINSLYIFLTPRHLRIPSRAQEGSRLLIRQLLTNLKEELNGVWYQWSDGQQWAASKLTRLYVEHILAALKAERTVFSVDGDYQSTARLRAQLVVLRFELIKAFMPFVDLVSQILGPDNLSEVDPVINTHFVPYLIDLNQKWEDWTPEQRATLLATLEKVERDTRQARPTSVEDLLDRLANMAQMENALNLVHFSQAAVHLPGHLRLAEQTNYFRKLSPEEEAEGSRTLRSIGHRSALHHGTTKARWEAQWA